MQNNIHSDIQQKIEQGIRILKEGGLVAFPTDTVYGLGACANLTDAVKRIYEVKQRPLNMPLPLLIEDISQIYEFTKSISSTARLLINRFLPGGLTLVLPASDKVPGIITGEGTTVAVRVPAHPVPVALIKGLGFPIVGTSANISGLPSPLTADDVRSQLGNNVNLVIDGGRCPGWKESTIVDVTGKEVIIIREGAISRQELELVYKGTIIKKENK
jgi:L-threonylcarbamoyladenylate synthase